VSDDPRDALLAVAREIVAKRGYMGLTMRTASAAAGVTEDVALRYYRSRESLFAAAMRLPVDPVSAIPALMAPGIEGMGERLVRFTLDTLRDPAARDDLISLARTGVSAGQAVTGLQDFIETGVVDRVAGMIGVPDARMRSALITSYLMGVATMRYGVRLEPLASASDEEVIRMVAPVIQDLLDPRRPIPGSARARARATTSSAGSGQAPAASRQARKFDPDPAATRAAEASRIAAEAARSLPPKPASAPASAPRSRPSAQSARTAPTTRTPVPTSPAKAAPSSAPSVKAATGPAAQATTKAGTGTKTRTAGTKTAATKTAATKTAATKTAATKAATKTKAAAKKSPAKAPTKKAATKMPAQKKPAAPVRAAGPKHAQVPPEQMPTEDQGT
jgi:AcrR family transcriptional regulator